MAVAATPIAPKLHHNGPTLVILAPVPQLRS
jgi:hypothetical protein